MNLAVITGTNGGLGRSLKEAFAARRWDVVEISRPRFDLLDLDLDLVAHTLAEHPAPTRAILIHNACDMRIAPANQVGAFAAESIQINITSAIQLTSAFLTRFPNGEVALVSSGAAKRGIAGWSLYCAAKAAMEGFLRALDAEGTKTYSIDPGVIDTKMQAAIRESDFPSVETFRKLHSAGSLKSPEAAARAVLEPMALD